MTNFCPSLPDYQHPHKDKNWAQMVNYCPNLRHLGGAGVRHLGGAPPLAN